MAKNYESESKNSRNYTGTSDKNSYGNEMNHAGNVKNSVKSKNETDCRSKAKNKTSQSYSIRRRQILIGSGGEMPLLICCKPIYLFAGFCQAVAHLSLISYDITKRSLPCFRWKRFLQKCWIIMWTEGTR